MAIGQHIPTGMPAAIKIIKPEYVESDPDTAQELFENEVNALSTLKHPNIIKLYGSSTNGVIQTPEQDPVEVMYIATEFRE